MQSSSPLQHPAITKIVFLHQIFKFVRSISNIEDGKSLRRFYQLTQVHSSFHECLLSFSGPRKMSFFYNKKINDSVLEQNIVILTSSLQVLKLGWTSITNLGLKHIANLASLVELNLSNTNITDSAIHHLANLKSLEILGLGWTKICGEGLPHLANLKSLVKLDLNFTCIRDSRYLADFVALEIIDLNATGITDDGAKALGKIQSLREVWLDETNITDFGLQHLLHLPFLDPNKVHVSSTGVSQVGLENFKKRLRENQQKQQNGM
jgi:hypothetical protein